MDIKLTDDGCRRLAAAVIATAWADAITEPEKGLLSTEKYRALKEAQEWLMAKSGAWAEARSVWCGLANVCPDRLRSKAVKVITPALQMRQRDAWNLAREQHKERLASAEYKAALKAKNEQRKAQKAEEALKALQTAA